MLGYIHLSINLFSDKVSKNSLNGTVTTPWFEEDYAEEYFQEDKNFLLVLELPKDIKNQIGSGSLIIELEVDTREEVGRVEEVSLLATFTLHATEKSWSEAESDCSFTVYVKGASPFVK